MFQKQLIMRRVLYSLVPIYLFAIYLYGYRVLLLMLVVFPLGIAAEYVMEKTRGKKVSEAVLVTCALYTLAMPPKAPLWIAAIGILFAVFIGKEVYGGFGRNIFNPAITGRLFVYITFPNILQDAWMTPGNFGFAPDAVSSATPLEAMRGGELPELLNLFLGLRPGSIGESSVLLILAAAVYLIVTKTANWKLIVSMFGSALALSGILFFAGVEAAHPPIHAVMSGSILFVAVFMVTDPVSAPKRPSSQWIYGAIIGSASVVIRTFSLFPEGTSFALLLGNTFASLLDELVSKKKKSKKVAA